MASTIQLVTCFAVCGVASITDLRSTRIPNWLTLPALGLGLFFGALDGGSGALASLVGALICGLVPLCLCAIGAMGGGDLKLLMAIGALLGAQLGLTAQLYAFATASVWGLSTWIARGQFLAACRRLVALALRRSVSAVPGSERTRLRFAPSVLLGVSGTLIGFVGLP